MHRWSGLRAHFLARARPGEQTRDRAGRELDRAVRAEEVARAQHGGLGCGDGARPEQCLSEPPAEAGRLRLEPFGRVRSRDRLLQRAQRIARIAARALAIAGEGFGVRAHSADAHGAVFAPQRRELRRCGQGRGRPVAAAAAARAGRSCGGRVQALEGGAAVVRGACGEEARALRLAEGRQAEQRGRPDDICECSVEYRLLVGVEARRG